MKSTQNNNHNKSLANQRNQIQRNNNSKNQSPVINIEKQQVPEPKKRFKLEIYNLITELNKITDLNNENDFYNVITKHCETHWSPIPTPEKDINYLWNFIIDRNLTQVMLSNLSNNTAVAGNLKNVKESNAAAALIIRIERFKLKLVTVTFLHSCSPTKLAVIKLKLNHIFKELKTKRIYLNPTTAPKVYEVTLESTIKAMVKTISECEMQLRELLRAFIADFKIDAYSRIQPNIS